jgi:hypothetical protein
MKKLHFVLVIGFVLSPLSAGAENINLLRVNASSSATSSGKCYVGCVPKAGTPKDCRVACGNDTHNGTAALHQSGHSTIILGPTTWEKCRKKMKKLGMPGW